MDEPPASTGFDSRRWTPAPALRGDVVRLTGYVETAGPTRYVEPPPTFVVVVLNVGGPYRVRAAAGTGAEAAGVTSFVGGLTEAPVVVESAGDAVGLQLDLTPLAASRLLGLAMHELSGSPAVAVGDVLGREGERLEEQLAGARDWEARRRLVEAFATARLEAAAPVPADVAYAWRRLEETRGRLAIGALAAELGCSRKHLIARFRDRVGVPPKRAAMLMRFNHARRLLEGGVAAAEVALRCGYADQPHLVNEFRRFAGAPPGQFLQDESARAA